MNNGRRRGFSLMELLVVMGVIAALAALALPLFLEQLDQQRMRADAAIARDAYAAAQSEYLMGGHVGKAVTFYYDEGTGTVSTSKPNPNPYYGSLDRTLEQNDQNGYQVGNVWVEGNAKKQGYVAMSFDSNGKLVSIAWGEPGMGLWYSIAGTPVSNIWWDHNGAREASFNRVIDIDNSIRLDSDLRILRALASYFIGKTPDEIKAELGETRYGNFTDKNGARLFEYCRDNGGSIRIKGDFFGSLPGYFAALGYDPGVYTSDTSSVSPTYSTNPNANNYLSMYLFTSDQMIGHPSNLVYRWGGEVVRVVNLRLQLNADKTEVVGANIRIQFQGKGDDGTDLSIFDTTVGTWK